MLVIALAVVAIPTAARADGGLVAEWGFGEGSGQVVRDGGPFGLAGRLGATDGAESADPERIAGVSGGALRFDGSTFVSLPDRPQLAPERLTAEAVVRAPASPGTYRYILSGGGYRCWAGSYGLYSARAGGLAFYVFDGKRYILSPTARVKDVWDGAWHSVAGSFDGRVLRLFVDGREVGTPMPAPVQIRYGLPSTSTLIGGYAGTCDRELGFEGDLDLVRLYSRALAPETLPGKPDPATGPGTDPSTTAPAPETPGPRPPLPAAEPGMVLPADPPPAAVMPPKTSRGCAVHVSRSRIAAGRRVVVRARLANPPRKRKLTLTIRRGGRTVASARLKASGSTRLVLRPQRSGRLTVRVAGRTNCASARLSVKR